MIFTEQNFKTVLVIWIFTPIHSVYNAVTLNLYFRLVIFGGVNLRYYLSNVHLHHFSRYRGIGCRIPLCLSTLGTFTWRAFQSYWEKKSPTWMDQIYVECFLFNLFKVQEKSLNFKSLKLSKSSFSQRVSGRQSVYFGIKNYRSHTLFRIFHPIGARAGPRSPSTPKWSTTWRRDSYQTFNASCRRRPIAQLSFSRKTTSKPVLTCLPPVSFPWRKVLCTFQRTIVHSCCLRVQQVNKWRKGVNYLFTARASILIPDITHYKNRLTMAFSNRLCLI